MTKQRKLLLTHGEFELKVKSLLEYLVLKLKTCIRPIKSFFYIPINDTTIELSVFWPSDTESQINELRFSDSVSLSFKKRLTSVTCFCGDVIQIIFKCPRPGVVFD